MKSFKQIFNESRSKIHGIAAAPGIVMGQAYLFTKEKIIVSDGRVEDTEEAKKNLEEALNKSRKELNKILTLAREKMEDTRAAIFEAHVMILDDPVLFGNVRKRIEEEKRLPEYIVDDEISKYQRMMKTSHEAYMVERANDIEDIKNRIVRNLQKKRWESKIKRDVIVVSDSLSPADTILLSRNNIKGFVTDHGGITSHTAIISRSLNLPAVVGTHNSTMSIKEDDFLIVDGFHGYVIVNPDESEINFFNNKIVMLAKLNKELEEFVDKPSTTLDNKEIGLYANVDVSGEIDVVITTKAKGIGLYRTEQIIEEFNDFPSEEEQTAMFKKLADRIYPGIITIRAFDIGGDKVKFLDFKEPNPFLGLRGIRLLLDNISLFKTQIRAVLKASTAKNIQFMLPMVSTLEEIITSKEIIKICKKELKEEKMSFDKDIKIGIMVEVPSAAVMTYEFAKEADFLSIGTNDLIQYLMAVDRGNDLVADLYQEFSPVVVRTISHIVKEAARAGREVSICGEMAADPLAIPLLVGLGLKSLSMSPVTILEAKKIIRNFEYSKAVKLAEECLELPTNSEIIAKIEKFFSDNLIIRTREIIS